MSFSRTRWAFGLILGAGLLAALTPPLTHAETDSKKEQDIRKLLKVSGIHDQLTYMKDGVLNSYSQLISVQYTEVPDAFWTEFNELVGKEEMKQLIDRVVPIYDKHMSHEAIQKLIEMFENPFWKKWREKMPLISREAGAAGNEWMQALMRSEAFNEKVAALIEKYELKSQKPEGHPTP